VHGGRRGWSRFRPGRRSTRNHNLWQPTGVFMAVSCHWFSHPQRKETIMKITRNIGFLLLAIWLILYGLSAFISLAGLAPILAILAIAAGVFILIGR
jgi:hypothetical protein